MAIAFDAASDGGAALPGTSLSWSHTCTGSDRLLRVGVRGSSGGSDVVSGVTYNGVSLTKIGSSYRGNSDRWCSLWELANPASGSNTVVVSSSNDIIIAIAASYTGANVNDANGTATNPISEVALSASLTPGSDNCWVAMLAGCPPADPGAGTGTTKRIGSSYGVGLFDNNAAISPAASTTLQSTTSPDGIQAIIIASITLPGGGGTKAPLPFRRAVRFFRRSA